MFVKESDDGFPNRALVFTDDGQAYSGFHYPVDEVVAHIREARNINIISHVDDCMMDLDWREGAELEPKLFYRSDNKVTSTKKPESYCDMGKGYSASQTVERFYDKLYQEFMNNLEAQAIFSLLEHSSHLGDVNPQECVQLIRDIKIDIESKNGTAKLLSTEEDKEAEDVPIQFQNLLLDNKNRLHGYHTIFLRAPHYNKTYGVYEQKNIDPLLRWAVGDMISGTWKHGIMEGIAVISTTPEKLVSVEGIVKENCFHGPVIAVNVQPHQPVGSFKGNS